MKHLIATVVVASISACSHIPASSTDNNTLQDQWLITSINKMAVISDSKATITFTEDNKINGNASCNNFFGGYTQQDNKIDFGPTASTKMLCMDNVNQQEQRFLQVLSNVDHYQIDNNTLILSNENNSETITAIRRWYWLGLIMKINKLKLASILTSLIIAAGIILFVVSDKSEMIRKQFEIYASSALGTQVSLNHLNISLRSGGGEFQQLSVKNPPQYTSQYALQIADAVLQVDLNSLNNDVKIIDNITVLGAQFTVEQKGGNINIAQLQKNIKNNQDKAEKPEIDKADQPASDNKSGDELKLAIRKLVLSDNTLKLISDEYGTAEIKIPNITLTNIGSADNGLTSSQLTSRVMEKIFDDINKNAQKEIREKSIQKLKDKVSDSLNKLFGD